MMPRRDGRTKQFALTRKQRKRRGKEKESKHALERANKENKR